MRYFKPVHLFSIVFLSGIMLLPQNVEGQIRSRMSLSVWQGDGEKITLKALLRARIDRRYVGLSGLKVQFRNLVDEEEIILGQAETAGEGVATLELSPDELQANTDSFFVIEAVFAGNGEYGESDDDLEFKPVVLSLNGFMEDSLRYVKAILSSAGQGVAGEDIALYVKSLTYPLMIAEEETDDQGEITFTFPMDLPGNPDGTIDIRAFVEDSDDYGNIESWLTTDWGVERILDAGTTRALWSPAPPLWLFLVFIGILVFIWGHYLVVIYELFKLRKSARSEA